MRRLAVLALSAATLTGYYPTPRGTEPIIINPECHMVGGCGTWVCSYKNPRNPKPKHLRCVLRSQAHPREVTQ